MFTDSNATEVHRNSAVVMAPRYEAWVEAILDGDTSTIRRICTGTVYRLGHTANMGTPYAEVIWADGSLNVHPLTALAVID